MSHPNLIVLSEYLNKGMDSCRLEVKNPAFGIGSPSSTFDWSSFETNSKQKLQSYFKAN